MRQTFDETTERAFGARHLPLIRQAMAEQKLDGFLVPHEDEHQNEYLPEANDRLAWATGFTGSAGAAVILKDKAAVFVDGRYTLQVRDQVDESLFEIRDLVEGGVPAYLESAAGKGQAIGYDPRLHSPDGLARVRAAVEKAGAELKPVEQNPLDAAWGAKRPAQPQAPVLPHPLDYAGEESAAKRARIGKALAAKGAEAAVITAPASIAWLFNIRGGDVIRSPLPLAQAILDASGRARLFLDPAKVSTDLPAWLGNEVSLETADDLPGALADLKGQKVLVDPGQSSAWYFDTLEAAGAQTIRADDPCALPRACKNPIEIHPHPPRLALVDLVLFAATPDPPVPSGGSSRAGQQPRGSGGESQGGVERGIGPSRRLPCSSIFPSSPCAGASVANPTARNANRSTPGATEWCA